MRRMSNQPMPAVAIHVLEQAQVVELAKKANAEGAMTVLSEFREGRLGAPRTWLNQEDAAAYLTLTSSTLSGYEKRGVAPKSVKIGGGRRYNVADLDAWVRAGGILAFQRSE